MVTTWEGNSALAAQSADSPRTWSSVGISPVTKSQNRPSGRGSWPPGALVAAPDIQELCTHG